MKIKRYGILHVGLTAAVMMLIIMLPSMIQNHGIFIIRGDYIDQYIPRMMKIKEIFDNGCGDWDWFNLYGAPFDNTDFIITNFICLLFPANLIPWVITYIHPFRMALIAVSAYAYLHYMVKNEKHAFLGAVLYTFSSFTFVCAEYMQFYEGFWAFPLLLLSVEKMFREEKYRHQLIFAVFLSCITHFYMFVFSTISFAIYFVCRFFFSDEWKEKRKIKYFVLAVFEYVIGFLCSFAFIITFIGKLFNSGGSTGSVGSFAIITPVSFFWNSSTFSRVISLFVPAASNRFGSFGPSVWSTRATYLPVFGFAFVLACICRKNTPRWMKLLCVANILCIFPGSSLIFNLYTASYSRHSYCIMLIFALATIMFMNHYNDKIAKRSIYITFITLCVLLGFYYFANSFFDADSVVQTFLHDRVTGKKMERMHQMYICIVSLVMYALLFLFLYSERVRKRIVSIVVAVVVLYGCSYMQLNLNDYNLMDYFTETTMGVEQQAAQYFVNIPEMDQDDNYRIDHSRHLRNYASAIRKPSLSVFESACSKYADETCTYFDYYRSNVEAFPLSASNELRTLLGVKYYYDLYSKDDLPIPDGFTYIKTDQMVDIYENEHYMGMGFSYHYYMLRSEFEKIAGEHKNCASVMLNALIVEDRDEPYVSDVLTPYKEGGTNKRLLLEDFQRSSDGFMAKIYTEEPQVIFMSVPYEDEGWKAYVNGKESDFIRANVGFMAIKTEAGENQITFIYKNPVRKYGYILSGIGLVILIAYLSMAKKRVLFEGQRKR